MRTRNGLIAAGAAVVLALGGADAYAAATGPVDSGGVIYGCYTNAALKGTHVIVLQDAGSTCPKGTTAVSWNQQGPAGVAGPAGPTGPAGDIGSPGPAGPAGPAGAAGTAGSNGKTVLNGTGAPDNSIGSDGDFYIDTAANVLYGPKAGGAWASPGVSLVGSAGPAGAAGPAGPAGPAGSPSSLDDLNGLPCENGAGNTSVSYNASGNVAIQCIVTPSGPTGDSQANPIDIGTKLDGPGLTCGALPITQTGVTTSQGYVWYEFSVSPTIIGNCELQVVVSPAGLATGTPGAEFQVYFNSVAIENLGSRFTIISNELTPTAPIIYIAVRSLPVRQSVNYTLTWNAIACPCTSGPTGYS